MQALLGKIALRMDPAIPARFETMHVEATVTLADGSIVATRCDGPRGMWGRPRISDAEHLVKVRDCLATALAPDAVERCISRAARIDELSPQQVSELMALVGAAATGDRAHARL